MASADGFAAVPSWDQAVAVPAGTTAAVPRGEERAMAGKNKGGRETRKPKKDKKVKGVPSASQSPK
jgi:hypothetical protein